MLIYFLRHGEADWPDWKKPDDERPLTEKGKKEMHQVGAFLANLSVKPDVVLTSPLPRASQTAEIAKPVGGDDRQQRQAWPNEAVERDDERRKAGLDPLARGDETERPEKSGAGAA